MPSPMILDLQNGSEQKIRGEVTEKHVRLVANYLGSDETAVENLIENDLPSISALAKKNEEGNVNNKNERAIVIPMIRELVMFNQL